MAHGVMHSRRWPIIVGLTLLMLKPQLGLAYAATLMFARATRAAVVIAGAITAALAAPALLAGGPVHVLSDFIANTNGYAAQIDNAPDAKTGLANLFFRIFPLQAPILLWIGLAAIAALAGWGPIRRAIGVENSVLALLIAATLAIGLFVPLHDYDFVVVFPLAGFVCLLRGPALVLALCAALAPTLPAAALGTLLPGEGWLADQRVSVATLTIAMLASLAAATLALRDRRH
jgi:hypothetical protein